MCPLVARRAYCVGDIQKSCPSVRSSVSPLVRPFVSSSALGLERENRAKMELLEVNGRKTGSKMGPRGQKCHHIRI